MRKVPTIVLSITYKGVKFIDAANKVSLYTRTLPCSRKSSLFNPACHVLHQIEQSAKFSFRNILGSLCMKVLQSNITLLLFCDCKCHACKFMSGLFMFVFPDGEQVCSCWHLFDINKKKKTLKGCLGSSARYYVVWLHFTAMARFMPQCLLFTSCHIYKSYFFITHYHLIALKFCIT